jgi:hypothetical protein
MAEKHTFRLRVMGEIPSIYENGEAFTGIALEGSHEAIRSVARHFLDAVVVTPADIHDKLVEALKAAREYLEGGNPLHASGGHRNTDLRDQIDAVLASLNQESGQ